MILSALGVTLDTYTETMTPGTITKSSLWPPRFKMAGGKWVALAGICGSFVAGGSISYAIIGFDQKINGRITGASVLVGLIAGIGVSAFCIGIFGYSEWIRSLNLGKHRSLRYLSWVVWVGFWSFFAASLIKLRVDPLSGFPTWVMLTGFAMVSGWRLFKPRSLNQRVG